MNYNKLISVSIIVFFIIGIISLIILIILYNKKNNESFKPEPLDRTILYGSIFLDNLDTQIQNLTNPPIMYDTKRIEIIRYSDLLL